MKVITASERGAGRRIIILLLLFFLSLFVLPFFAAPANRVPTRAIIFTYAVCALDLEKHGASVKI